jgi:hypothetical protein
MGMNTNQTDQGGQETSLDGEIAALHAAYIAAVDHARRERTAEAREAVIAAWAKYDSAGKKRKSARYASRAGMRQAAERRAITRR